MSGYETIEHKFKCGCIEIDKYSLYGGGPDPKYVDTFHRMCPQHLEEYKERKKEIDEDAVRTCYCKACDQNFRLPSHAKVHIQKKIHDGRVVLGLRGKTVRGGVKAPAK